MKTIVFFLLLLVSKLTYAQDVSGTWNGVLSIPGAEIRLVFHIQKMQDGYHATMDSPDQGIAGIAVNEISFKGSTLKMEVTDYVITYKGKLTKAGVIEGTFKQGDLTLPLNLSKGEGESKKMTRPQDPVEPYPYYSEEVRFENYRDSITLSGTLTLPEKEGVFPVVILISGSGPQNRNEELMGHKPFLVIADHLTCNGIGVLRFDDRGTAESTGNFETATTADFARDVEAALDYLLTRKDVNKTQIGLIGHSEGGIIAPIVAAERDEVSYIVLLAGTGIRGDELLLLQQELISRANGVPEKTISTMQEQNAAIYDIITTTENADSLDKNLRNYLAEIIEEIPQSQKPKGVSDAQLLDQYMATIASPWMIYFIRYDPSLVLKDVKCPVLAINGNKDLQVPAERNLAAIKKGLEEGGNQQVTIKELPDLNHLFQESTTGSPTEYASIEQTFSPLALNEISNWIKEVIKQ